MSENTTGKIIVEEPHKSQHLRPLEAGLDFGFLTPHSTSKIGLLITNPDDCAVEWRIQIGTEKPGMGVRETLEHTQRPAGIKESFSIVKDEGVILGETEGQLHRHESRTVYVTINTTNLEPGYAYTTNLTLISQAADTPPTSMLVPLAFGVSFSIHSVENDGGPRAPVGLPSSINFSGQGGHLSTIASLSFTNDNPKAVDWKLAPDAGPTWLVVSPSHGTFGKNGQAKVGLTADATGLSKGTYTTNLNLTLTWHDGSPGKTDAKPIPVFFKVQ